MEQGHPAGAARIFHQLAEAATYQQMPLRAARLTLAAAHAEALSGQGTAAAEHAIQALAVFAEAGHAGRVAPVAERVITALHSRGHEQAAANVERQLEADLGRSDMPQEEIAPSSDQVSDLPAKCFYCGGPVVPNELEWIEETTAICAYCGSPVKPD
jgi:hypothetical protein